MSRFVFVRVTYWQHASHDVCFILVNQYTVVYGHQQFSKEVTIHWSETTSLLITYFKHIIKKKQMSSVTRHRIWLRLSTMTGLLTNYNSYSWPIHMCNNSNKNRFHIWSVSHNTPIYSYFVLLHTGNKINCHKCLCFRIMLCFTPGKLYAGDVLICSVNAANIYQ